MPEQITPTRSTSFSTNAIQIDTLNVCNNISLAQWTVDRNYVKYQRSHGHTLSLYLSGGENSFREDQKGHFGGTGAICIMPEGHQSKWHINGKINFAHLYFSNAAFKEFAALTFDTDPRFIDLEDVTYAQDMVLRHQIQEYFRIWARCKRNTGIAGEEILYRIFGHLLTTYTAARPQKKDVKGGLSPRHMKIVREAITSSLETKIRITDLAGLVGLSPFHFCRMFKETCGLSPANFITALRIEKVKQLLPTENSLASIGAATGFCQQSHMTSSFKKATGYTPYTYREILRRS